MTALRLIAAVTLSVMALSVLSLSVIGFSMNLTNYKLTFEQDFTTMKNLSVTDWGPNGPGGSVWIAHKPDGEDWCDFYNPTAPYLPFNIGDGKLTIRASVTNITGKPQYYAGMLSTNDPKGNGFSQRYGYFEMKAKLPLGLGGWPAFWLMDSDGMRNRSLGTYHELDILEEYGDNPALLHATLHLWDSDSSKDWGYGYVSHQCSMTTGFHTYGLDLQPDFLTFYYDRQMIVRAPNYIPINNSTYDREMFVMV